jgi:ABC-type glycerol-3-phosphate transport system permease component
MLTLLAHGGHPVYDHPAMAAIAVAAIVIPLVVLGVVGRIFVRAARDEERDTKTLGDGR